MTNLTSHLTPSPVAIEVSDRKQAYQFAARQPTVEKVEQVYRNTLSVLTVQRYLQLLGIETAIDKSHSLHSFMQTVEDIADLFIPGLSGRFECRCVKAGDRTCTIPKSTWDNRLGYVILQLDPPYQQAQMLGFVESVSVEQLPLSYLKPLDELIELFLDTGADTKAAMSPSPVALRQWLDGLFTADWQRQREQLMAMRQTVTMSNTPLTMRHSSLRRRLESLYQQQPEQHMTQQANPLTNKDKLSDQEKLIDLMRTTQDDNIRWQAAELLWELAPSHPACPIITSKDLGVYLAGHQLALAIGLLPKPNGSFLLLTRLYPLGNEAPDDRSQKSCLPTGLRLMGTDEGGNVF